MKYSSAMFPVECSTNTFLGLRMVKNKLDFGGKNLHYTIYVILIFWLSSGRQEIFVILYFRVHVILYQVLVFSV